MVSRTTGLLPGPTLAGRVRRCAAPPCPTMTTNARSSSLWYESEGFAIHHVDLAPDADREAQAFALLDDEEKSRWHRFPTAAPRRRFALCRAELRRILAAQLGCSNRQLSFGKGEHGKPFALVDGGYKPVGFNVSHSGRHGLIAIGSRDRLGVDVEERASGRDLEGIGSMVFGPAEQRVLALAAGSRKVQIFYRLWTMKEALIKAQGSGFAMNPAGFEVPEAMLQGARSSILQLPREPASNWRLVDLGEARFAAALAYRVSPPSPHGLPIRASTER